MTNTGRKTGTDAYNLWRDIVGDSGEAPTQWELFAYFNVVRAEAADEIAEWARSNPELQPADVYERIVRND